MSKVNIVDITKRLDPNGKIAAIAELLEQSNEILTDMPLYECNNGDGHKVTIRNELPDVSWRMFNYGVKNSKSKTQQVTDTTGMLEAYAEVDKDLAELNGNTKEFRLSEDRAFLEAMNQEFARTLFYGNTNIKKSEFMGLAPRYNAFATNSGTSADHVIDCGGTTNLTSIYLVVWGQNTVFGLYPNGSKAGLTMNDKGQVTLEDADGGKYEGYRSHYQLKTGLTVKDWRYVVRLANIDVTALKADPTTGELSLIDKIIDAIELIPNINLGKPVFYGNKKITSALRKQIKNAKNVTLSLEEVFGKKVLHVDGIPFRKTDALLNTESKVNALA